MGDTTTGSCFCGAVELEVTVIEVMGYCHCASCRSWSASPVNAFMLWKPENVKVTKGQELIGHYQKTPTSDRQFCTESHQHPVRRRLAEHRRQCLAGAPGDEQDGRKQGGREEG